MNFTCTVVNKGLLSTALEQNNLRHGLVLLWFKDLLNVTEKLQFRDPTFSTILCTAFIRGDLIAVTRGPFIHSLISCPFFLMRCKIILNCQVNFEYQREFWIATTLKLLKNQKPLDRSVETLGLWIITSRLRSLNLQTRVA